MKSPRLSDKKPSGPLLVSPSPRGITLRVGTDATTAIGIGILAVGCVVMGAAIAGGPAIGGHRLARAAIIGIPLIVGAVALIVDLGPKALPIWVAVSPLVYPFLRYPFHRGGYVTFDRVWIFALFLILLRLPRPPSQHHAGRLLRDGMVLLAGVWTGMRLLLAPFGRTEARYWLDAMVLPIVVYCVTRRVVFQQGEGGVIGALVVAGVVMSVISIAELVLGFKSGRLQWWHRRIRCPRGRPTRQRSVCVQRRFVDGRPRLPGRRHLLDQTALWRRQDCRICRGRHHRRRRIGVVPSRRRYRRGGDLDPRHRVRGPQPQRALRNDQHDRRRCGTRLLRRVGKRRPFDLLPGPRCLDDKCHRQVRVMGSECCDLQGRRP